MQSGLERMSWDDQSHAVECIKNICFESGEVNPSYLNLDIVRDAKNRHRGGATAVVGRQKEAQAGTRPSRVGITPLLRTRALHVWRNPERIGSIQTCLIISKQSQLLKYYLT